MNHIYITYYSCGDVITQNIYEAVQAGEFTGFPIYKDEYSIDPVFNCRYVYEDGGWTFLEKPPTRPRSEYLDKWPIA
jgi:hypothetical protein